MNEKLDKKKDLLIKDLEKSLDKIDKSTEALEDWARRMGR